MLYLVVLVGDMQESDGQIGDVEIVNGELRGKTFTLPGCG